MREDNTAVLRLHLRNENIVPVAVTATELKAFFNGTGYGKATGEKPFALKEYGEADHEAILRLGDAAAAERLKSALAAGVLTTDWSAGSSARWGGDAHPDHDGCRPCRAALMSSLGVRSSAVPPGVTSHPTNDVADLSERI
jgi:hypothetical protein